MRITRFAAVLSLALAAAPTLMAATRFTPVTTASSSSMATATALPADMGLLASLRTPVTFQRAMFTFTVTVNGSTDVATNSPAYVFSTVSGGTAPYSYWWYLDGIGMNVPTSATGWSQYLSYGTHYTYAWVTDATGQGTYSNQFFIHVH